MARQIKKRRQTVPLFDLEKNVVEEDKKVSKYSIVILKDGREN